jgi:ElaB/YqjD/DUF883 family membrane-anchored ribosome-binding protein
MDIKKIVDQVKDSAEDLKKKAEAKIQEARDTLDKNHDNIPDALEGLTEKATKLAGQVQDKAKEMGGQAEGKAKEVAGKAQETLVQTTAKLGEMADQAKGKLKELKGDADKAVDSAIERMGISDKNSKKG